MATVAEEYEAMRLARLAGPRCSERGCAYRFGSGKDRLCPVHLEGVEGGRGLKDDEAAAMARFEEFTKRESCRDGMDDEQLATARERGKDGILRPSSYDEAKAKLRAQGLADLDAQAAEVVSGQT